MVTTEKHTQCLLEKYRENVPRYTSYPTAAHFSPEVDEAVYHQWISRRLKDEKISLYLHIPFCQKLCYFCGCHTKIVNRYKPIQGYIEQLAKEIELVTEILPQKLSVQHVHFGGGSPNILLEKDFSFLVRLLRKKFVMSNQTDVAIEIDPREISQQAIESFSKEGVSRLSLGVQDVNPKVQRAINRIQPYSKTQEVVACCRANGISKINMDLIYGLPFQTPNSFARTIDLVLKLLPSRISLFGYAHVPWMKSHQRLIAEKSLPDMHLRLALYQIAVDRLQKNGYRQIGLDHFAMADDEMTKAHDEKRLQRNFQGYTTDTASSLIGFGASAISHMPEGYIQNFAKLKEYQFAIEQGTLPIARGIEVTQEDRMRRKVIETLMCYLEVDLKPLLSMHRKTPNFFSDELKNLKRMEKEGLIKLEDYRIIIPNENRIFVRTVCSLFDVYFRSNQAHHSRPI